MQIAVKKAARKWEIVSYANMSRKFHEALIVKSMAGSYVGFKTLRTSKQLYFLNLALGQWRDFPPQKAIHIPWQYESIACKALFLQQMKP